MISIKSVRYAGAVIGALAAVLVSASGLVSVGQEVPEEVRTTFEYLSKNGNSNCSPEFMKSVSSMPAVALLQGSCCSPMDLHRYHEQTGGLKAYAGVDLIPPDPYNIPAALAARLMEFYEAPLSPAQQAAYDYAMKNSNEGGPCCCECWRWVTYGGLGKHLIRDRGFSGEQIAQIWDLSDGCGGEGSHAH